MLSPRVRGRRTRTRERGLRKKPWYHSSGIGEDTEENVESSFFFFFSCCRGPDAAQRAHDVSAFGVVSGKGREVGWRGGEEQAVSVKCWLMGLRAADQTPWLGP